MSAKFKFKVGDFVTLNPNASVWINNYLKGKEGGCGIIYKKEYSSGNTSTNISYYIIWTIPPKIFSNSKDYLWYPWYQYELEYYKG